jgi:hypothetical protein
MPPPAAMFPTDRSTGVSNTRSTSGRSPTCTPPGKPLQQKLHLGWSNTNLPQCAMSIGANALAQDKTEKRILIHSHQRGSEFTFHVK